MDAQEEQIEAWKNFILNLPHNKFVTLMELNLGKMESPFNKQKLIQKLMSFLQKTSTKEAIIKGLDRNDLILLKSIHDSGGISESNLIMLFSSKFSQKHCIQVIANMEARLLIYRRYVQSEARPIYEITPFLKESLQALLEKNIFLMPEKVFEDEAQEILVKDTFLCAILSFCFQNSGDSILKVDGSLKKKTVKQLVEIFPDVKDNLITLEYILASCLNLSLMRSRDASFIIHTEKCRKFSKLSNKEKYVYLLAGAMPKFSKEYFQEFVFIISKFFSSVEFNAHYSKKDLQFYFLLLFVQEIKNTYLIYEFLDAVNEYQNRYNIVEIALSFGLLCEDDKGFVFLNPKIRGEDEAPAKPIIIDQSFDVTVLPNANLRELIDLIPIIEPISVQTIGTFRISKNACLKNFEKEIPVEEICDKLEKASSKEIPKSVFTSINEWHKKITSISLYKGFVVKVTQEQEKLFEYDAKLKKLIRKKISDGVYLLNIYDIEEFEKAIKSAKLDFVFYKKKMPPQPFGRGDFRRLDINFENKSENKNFIKKSDWMKEQKQRDTEHKLIEAKLKAKLEGQTLSSYAKDYIISCIEDKTIFSEEQIINSPYLNMKEESAMGLDFSGKLRLIQKSIKNNIPIAIETRRKNEMETIYGKSVELLGNSQSPLLFMEIPDEGIKKGFPVAEISKVTLMPFSIFS